MEKLYLQAHKSYTYRLIKVTIIGIEKLYLKVQKSYHYYKVQKSYTCYGYRKNLK